MTSQPFSPLKRTKSLVDEVASQLAQRISLGEFRPGDRLPTGSELTEAFGVSLAVIREAMSKLKHDGLIETQQGSGSFVAQPGQLRVFRLDSNGDEPMKALQNIYELRLPFETRAAELAAERRTEADLQVLEARLAEMGDTSLSPADRAAADQAFHEAVATATGNVIYRDFVRFLASHLVVSINLARNNSTRFLGFSEQAHSEHEQIYRAIHDGDGAAAAQAAAKHVHNASRRLNLHMAEGAKG